MVLYPTSVGSFGTDQPVYRNFRGGLRARLPNTLLHFYFKGGSAAGVGEEARVASDRTRGQATSLDIIDHRRAARSLLILPNCVTQKMTESRTIDTGTGGCFKRIVRFTPRWLGTTYSMIREIPLGLYWSPRVWCSILLLGFRRQKRLGHVFAVLYYIVVVIPVCSTRKIG